MDVVLCEESYDSLFPRYHGKLLGAWYSELDSHRPIYPPFALDSECTLSDISPLCG